VLGIDPVADGAAVQIFNDTGTGESACLTLPSAGWSASGSGATRKFKYKDPSGAFGPCKSISLKTGKPLKVSCQAKVQPIPYTLDEPAQGALGVRFTSGGLTYCARFGGDVKHDDPVGSGGKFQAVRAQAPVACPVPPASCP
jgi:hypothetical protein